MTIVAISDLHIGNPASLLTLDSVKRKLLESLLAIQRDHHGIQRFILLGDILDLTMSPASQCWLEGRDFFHYLFTRVAGGSTIYYVPGNHDHHLWTMLLEEHLLTAPLRRIAETDGESLLLQLETSRLVGGFTPKDKTFVHALFPKDARERLYIEYPFVRWYIPGHGDFFAHHGHYFDTGIMPLAKKVAYRHREQPDKVEEANLAWIESLFYFASRGRMAREYLNWLHHKYRFVLGLLDPKSPLRFIVREDSPQKSNVRFHWIKHFLRRKRVRRIVNDLYDCKAFTLVQGHTHVAQAPTGKGPVMVFDTGGWQVEKNVQPSSFLRPAVFVMDGDQRSCITVDVDDKEVEEAGWQA